MKLETLIDKVDQVCKSKVYEVFAGGVIVEQLHVLLTVTQKVDELY